MFEMWEKRKIEKQERLIPIPFVVSQTRKQWKIKPFWAQFKGFKKHPELRRFFPNFEFLHLDVSKQNQTALSDMNAMHALAVMKTMFEVINKRFGESNIYAFFDELSTIILDDYSRRIRGKFFNKNRFGLFFKQCQYEEHLRNCTKYQIKITKIY